MTITSDTGDMYRRESCGACAGTWLEPVLNLGRTPLADAYMRQPVPQETWPLALVRCSECSLVQLEHVLPQEQLFGTGYSFYSSASAPLSRYHAQYAAAVLREYDLDRKKPVVEIGSNDGDFGRHLVAAGLHVIGVDPATGPAEVAAARGLETMVGPFTAHMADVLRGDVGPVQLVVANHVLAHVADVSDMLAGINILLADDGVAYVEVQYLPDLLLNNAIDLVYHEHRNFFSLHALTCAAATHGLHVGAVTFTERQGGSIRVVLSRNPDMPAQIGRILDDEQWLSKPGALAGLQGRANRLRDRIRDILNSVPDATIAGYGAPAKATTLLHWCGIDEQELSFVSDTTEAKQGMYVPGTGIPIISPEAAREREPDIYLMLAWNYLPEILRNEARFTSRRRWLVPIPSPVLI